MSIRTALQDRIHIGPLSDGWSRTDRSGLFVSRTAGRSKQVIARVRVFEPLTSNPDYLLRRFGSMKVGPVGRPQVEPLPESLEEGVSIISCGEHAAGALVARIDLVRRARNLDIIVSARTGELDRVNELYFEMLELLAAVDMGGAEL